MTTTPSVACFGACRRFLVPAAAAAVLLSPAVGSAGLLMQTSPSSLSYVDGLDFLPMLWSGVGDVTAPVSGVDLQLGLGNTSTSGCEAADFAGFAAGHIALIQRGACPFAVKATNAWNAGASGVLIFNQGDTDTPDRLELIAGTLGETFNLAIPVMGLSHALGFELANTAGLTMRMEVNLGDPIRPAPVPAPASVPLLAVGLAALAFARRLRG